MKKSEQAVITARIIARKKLLKKYVAFAQHILDDHGGLLSREVKSCNTKTEYLFNGFAHFSFYACYGQSSQGGNTIIIFYHPNLDTIEIGGGGYISVLEVYWQSFSFNTDECVVTKFNGDDIPPWQEALDRAIKDKDDILASIDTKVEVEKAKKESEIVKNKEINRLIAEQKRLGLTD